jgi:2-dehydropantoate 2-reductase
VVDLFRQAGLECQAREDIEAVLWEKLVVNVGINPLTALLRVPNGALLQLPPAWEVAVAAAAEAQAVAQAAGLTLSGDPAARLAQVCTATAANRSSMLQDILAGKQTEIEALNAQVATRGRALGVPTPVNDLLTRLLRAAEQSDPFRVA